MSANNKTIGLTKQALASYRRATELNDNQSDAWFGIADMSLDAGDILVAAAAYQKFRRIGQQDARSLLLGVRLGRAEKDVNAEASAALMLRNLFPDSAEYRRYKEMTP